MDTLPEGSALLDIGCGTGLFIKLRIPQIAYNICVDTKEIRMIEGVFLRLRGKEPLPNLYQPHGRIT
jgi:SAM-dependent methyltransferase